MTEFRKFISSLNPFIIENPLDTALVATFYISSGVMVYGGYTQWKQENYGLVIAMGTVSAMCFLVGAALTRRFNSGYK